MKNIPYWAKIIGGILICNGVGLLAGVVTIPAIPEWYATLNKPSFSPPNWIFGPVWTLLYTLMGISAAAIWQAGMDNPKVKAALKIFGLQLLLNGLWSFLFFYFKSPLMALLDILLLLIAILLTINAFRKVKAWAAWILLPYLIWVAFASALNLAIVILN